MGIKFLLDHDVSTCLRMGLTGQSRGSKRGSRQGDGRIGRGADIGLGGGPMAVRTSQEKDTMVSEVGNRGAEDSGTRLD